jgi:hypothetical protein
VKKLALAIAACCALACSPAQAKTFVGVLWPMFGPLPAIGLVELVAEIKMMPDVEVETYVHQAWPSLVEDLDRQPPGTHKVVIGYSLGANSSVSVANEAKYVDLIIALQPSMLSWNPPLTGKVGRMIEIYNPDPWMTWGGMGSKKLVGDNIEYIANNDSHPGAQFSSEFRNLAKTEIAKFTAQDRLAATKQAEPAPLAIKLGYAEEQPASRQKDSPAKDKRQIVQGQILDLPKLPPKSPAPQSVEASPKREAKNESSEQPKGDPKKWAAFADTLSNSVSAGELSAERPQTIADILAPERPLTRADMIDYAGRTYGASRTAEDGDGLQRVGSAER